MLSPAVIAGLSSFVSYYILHKPLCFSGLAMYDMADDVSMDGDNSVGVFNCADSRISYTMRFPSPVPTHTLFSLANNEVIRARLK